MISTMAGAVVSAPGSIIGHDCPIFYLITIIAL